VRLIPKSQLTRKVYAHGIAVGQCFAYSYGSMRDALTISDVVAIAGAVCALLMVVGSLLLLWKGAITLKEANPEEAIKVSFQRALSIQTRYPAIALFVVGIVFLFVASWLSRGNGPKQVMLTGTVNLTTLL